MWLRTLLTLAPCFIKAGRKDSQMAKNLKLLLTESVDNLGIVGDVVNVRVGYARNFLLPRNLATTPSEELIKSLSAKRAEAERQLALLRKHREEMIEKMQGLEIELVRSCNDQGILYASITQQDICGVMAEKGFGIKPREVRIAQTIKRIDHYDLHIKLDSDLDALIKLNVKADRELDLHKDKPADGAAKADGQAATDAENAPQDAKKDDARTERHDRGDRRDRGERRKKAPAPKTEAEIRSEKQVKGGWGSAEPEKTADKPDAKAEKASKGDKAEKKAKKKEA